MPIVTKKGNLLTDTRVEFKGSIVGSKAYVYVDYSPGTEDSVSLAFEIYEASLQDVFGLRDEAFNPVSLVLTGQDKSVYPISTPPSAEDLIISVSYNNLQKSDTRTYTADGTQTAFSDTLLVEVVPASLTITYTIGGVSYSATDDGNGNITGTNLTGTIDYASGALDLSFSTPPDAGTNVTVSYTYAKEGTVGLDVISDSPYA